MNQKIILPIVAAAVLLPVLAMLATPTEQTHIEPRPLEIPNTDKVVSIQSLDEVAFTLQERTKHSDLIIEGIVIGMVPLEKQIDPEDDSVWVFTVATVKVDEIFKGETEETTVNVQLYGGETDYEIAIAERHDIQINDTIIMFLEKNPDSIAGDNYALVGPTSGMYLIEDDTAKHYHEEKSLTAENLKDAIKTAQGLD